MADLNRIKTVLAERGIMSKWLAKTLHKDPATVSKWCNNHAQPDLKTLAQIAKVLKVDIHELICHTKAEWTEYEIYHRRGTEIQIKMFDDRIVFETPGKLPGIVRTDNIRHTHFSRNPKIAEYLKAYDYVKEFGEGVDRMCRELSAIGTKEPQYHLVAFIMKASVWTNVLEGQEKAREKQENIPSDQVEGNITQKQPRNYPETTQKQDIDITPVQKGIIKFLLLHPYAGRKEISSNLGLLSEDGVKYNLKVLQQKGIIKRIGPAKGGYWKVLSDETSG